MKTFYFSKTKTRYMGGLFMIKAKNVREAKSILRDKLNVTRLLNVILTFSEENKDD